MYITYIILSKGKYPKYISIFYGNTNIQYKHGIDKQITSNCIPIETCMKHRILNFVHKHKLLNINQFGFQEKKSNIDALCEVIEKEGTNA